MKNTGRGNNVVSVFSDMTGQSSDQCVGGGREGGERGERGEREPASVRVVTVRTVPVSHLLISGIPLLTSPLLTSTQAQREVKDN